ncbi:phosphoglycolate phosphatase [Alginatibacterium sediminis]|uniref:Phosphoglycolate phosphatase n=1 Tax=Alginatibacterium sediminis TaxID=2164068 RepID=A0A420EKW9_9ALTE|nr:phosphoglycolate phosphatase [Alginatibacterium sediminis]RKF21338.1 phosphoglycolate phosphatase [Alginatibacterium sediminis]
MNNIDFKALDLVIFDLDGTLVDSAPDLALAINNMLQDLERSTFAQELVCSWVGNGAEVLVRRALSGSSEIKDSIDEALYLKARTSFNHHYAQGLWINSSLYDGAIEALELLKQHHIPMALVTNKPLEFTLELLKLAHLESYFEMVLGGDCLAEKKPSPLPLLHVLSNLGARASHTLMVGDSRNDIEAAKAASCPSLGLSYGYNYGEDIASYGPDYTSDNLHSFFHQALNLVGSK